MDEDRIVQNFRNRMYASDVQIKVLCELTGKTRRQILTILHNAGEALDFAVSPKKYSDSDWQGIIKMRLDGYSIRQIAIKTNIPYGTITNWRQNAKRLGIEIPAGQMRKGEVMHG